jgi:hypothetical protein
MPTRKDLIRSLEKARESRLVCYFTGDRKDQEIQIGDDVLPSFSEHLSKIGKVAKLDLLIYSRGGNTLTGFAIANAMREFADHVAVLVPFRAHSCATLICLGAEEVVAGPFAQLSPIDPSITTPHGPTINQGGELKFLPVSVEDVANYFELARKEAGLKDEQHLAEVFGHLCGKVSPLALGAVYRAREQIGMLAAKLLSIHVKDPEGIDRIVKKLTRELLSHDYLIGRREAKEIGLSMVDATKEESDVMWQIYEDVAQELLLNEPWNWENETQGAQPKIVPRGVLESADLKHLFSTTYQIKRVTIQQAGQKMDSLQIKSLGEGWRRAK